MVWCKKGKDVSRKVVMVEKVLSKQVVYDVFDYETHV